MSIHLNVANVVVPATNGNSLAKLVAIPVAEAPWDCIELRLDRFAVTPVNIATPLLLTPRHPDEGGDPRCATDAQRAAIAEPWLPFASAIDVELAHADGMSPTLQRAKDAGLAVVLSLHDFESTPAADLLSDRVRRAIDAGADVVKLATLTETASDVARLISLFEEFPEQRLAVMGMGRLGMASRLLAACCGSVLNYASHGDATADGQWPAADFRRLLEQTGAR